MRTNNAKRTDAKPLLLLMVLFVCLSIVIGFAIKTTDMSVAPKGEIAFADEGDQGTTAGFFGDHGNLTAAMIGFPGTTTGKRSWTYTESFDTVYFSPDDNISIHVPTQGLGDVDYTYTPGTGQFGFNGPGLFAGAYDIYTVANYRIPGFIQNILGNSNITVNATFSANMTRDNGSTSGIFIMSSATAVGANSLPTNAYKSDPYQTYATTGTGNLSVNKDLTAGDTVVAMVAFCDNIIWQKINCTVRTIRIKFTITLTAPATGSDSHVINDGAGPIVASQYDTSGKDVYYPYLPNSSQTYQYTANGNTYTSTWPVWYSSIQSATALSTATDSVMNGGGSMLSYTNKDLNYSGSPTGTSPTGLAYYKYSSITYVDVYDYNYKSGIAGILSGRISLEDAYKTVSLGDKLLNGYDENTGITWKTGDANYCSGIKSVKIGLDTTFTVSSTSVGSWSGSKVIHDSEGNTVGCARIKRVNRARVTVDIYMYTNANITTEVADYGGSSTQSAINYSGIDTTNPNSVQFAYNASQPHDMTSNINASGNNWTWWRNSSYVNDNSDANIDDDEGEANFSPYLWFYRVDKTLTLDSGGVPQFDAAPNYADYSALKTAGYQPIAISDIANFKYDFNSGNATGINKADVPNVGATCTGSGWYRFIFYTVDLAGNMGTPVTYYVKADYVNPTFTTRMDYEDALSEEWFPITSANNGTWATGQTKIQIKVDKAGKTGVNTNGTNISGNTLVFESDTCTYAVVFDATKILKRIEGGVATAVNGTSTTFATPVDTDADDTGILRVTYYPVNSGAYFYLEFINTPDSSGEYPNIDWTTSFTIYAGQDYANDDEVSASDGWLGGVKIRIDRNIPDTPTISDVVGASYIVSGDNNYSATLPANAERKWFTEQGLSLDTILEFEDPLADAYGSDIKVYFGVRTIRTQEDFAQFVYNNTTYNNTLQYFTNNFRDVSVADYVKYFKMSILEAGSLDAGSNEYGLSLTQSDGAGMRVIYVWAVDQAGNKSAGISKYYVLADEYTYTISSSVKANAKLASGSAVITQANEEGDYSADFKRGDVVTFTIDMDAERYAPFTFKKTDNSGTSVLLSNYTPTFNWNVETTDFITGDTSAQTISWVVDDPSYLGALNAVINGKKRNISFEYAHREIVEYTITTWGGTYTGLPHSEISSLVLNVEMARDQFSYYFLDSDGTPIAAPTIPNEDDGYYLVAVYIPTDNPYYVVNNSNNVIVNEFANGAVGYVVDANGEYKLFEGEYVALTNEELETYTGTRYSLYDFANFEIGDGAVYHVGYQKVGIAKYTIGKGTATVKAVSSDSTYLDVFGTDWDLDYILAIGGKDYYPYGGYYYYVDGAGTYKQLDDGTFEEIIGEYDGTRYLRTEFNLTGVDLTLYTTVPQSAWSTLAVGTYVIENVGNLALQYFNVGYTSAIHTINTRKVNISTIAGTKVYGESDPDFTFKVLLSEFNGDEDALLAFFANFGTPDVDNVNHIYTFSSHGAIRRTEGEDVGEYGYLVSSSSFDIDANYSLTISNTVHFTITQRTILLSVAGQSLVKPSGTFNPTADYTSIVPTFSLSSSDMAFASSIVGHLALTELNTSGTGPVGDYEESYSYTIVLGTIADTLNFHFDFSGDRVFYVYIAAASARIITLKDGASISFVYGDLWYSSTSIVYSSELFEGLEDGDTILTWTASIAGYIDGQKPNAGNYIVNVNATGKDVDEGNIVVFVEPFTITFNPAVIVVKPTFTTLAKDYGESDNVFGIGYEIVSVNGEDVTNEFTYAGFTLQQLQDKVAGSFARGIFNGANMISFGTRYDDATSDLGVVLSNENLHYGVAVNTQFVSSDANFSVTPEINDSVRFLINKHVISVALENFTGIDKVADGTTDVNYAGTQIVYIQDQLVLSTDEVNIAYVAHYGTTEPGVDTDITFDSIGLSGAKACNYSIEVTGLVGGKMIIYYHNNSLQDVRIQLKAGSIGLSKLDVTISKQYDGTSALSVENVSIERYSSTTLFCNLLEAGKVRLTSGDFGSSYKVNNNYIVSIVLFFETGNDFNPALYGNDAVGEGVTIRYDSIGLDGVPGYFVSIANKDASIKQRRITSQSFASLTPVTRDYNNQGGVDVEYEFAANAIVAGDNVRMNLKGEIIGGDYSALTYHPIRFLNTSTISDSNYIIDIEELNNTYKNDRALQVYITRAKLIPNVEFESKQYDGTTAVVATSKESLTGSKFTTLNYSSELSSELATFTYDELAISFNLSVDGQLNGNVVIDRDGKVVAHNVLVSGLTVIGDADLLKNYEIYGYRYNGGSYSAVGTVLDTEIPAYELLDAVELTKRPITIIENNIDVFDKVYDGTRDAYASIVIDENTNVVEGDRAKLEITAEGEFEQKQAGTRVTVKISNIRLSVKDVADEYLLNNYVLSNYSGGTITRDIKRRPVTFTANLGSRTYTGDPVVSTNVIASTLYGLIEADARVNSYGVQIGSAYFIDKNVALDGEGNVTSKAGTVYNPRVLNTKALYINYVLTYAVDASEFLVAPAEYHSCETSTGAIYYFGDSRIAGAEIVKYYFDLPTTDKYIFANSTAKLEAAGENIVGYYVYNVADVDRAVYLVKSDYAGEIDGNMDEAVSYSQDASGIIRKKAAVINEVEKIPGSNAFSKQFDGTNKFYGVEGVDFTYNESGIGLPGDDLHIVGVVAYYEQSDVGDTYIVVKADRLGGADADNYTYGTLRSARVPATIVKQVIKAHLADGEMVYGTNLGAVEGNITYTFSEYDYPIILSNEGIMINFKQFLHGVGLIADLDEVVDPNDELLAGLIAKTYNFNGTAYVKAEEGTVGEYWRMNKNATPVFQSMPNTKVLFSKAKPTAGMTAGVWDGDNSDGGYYRLEGGYSTNFDFVPVYTNEAKGTSVLTVVKKDLLVVAVISNYQKVYGEATPTVTLNYIDKDGNPGIASGETWLNVFVKNGVSYRPTGAFYAYDGGLASEPISATAMVNDDPRFNGDYVFKISIEQGFEADNYNVVVGDIVTVDNEDKYNYQFAGFDYVAKVPQLTIVMPTMSGITLNETRTTTYNGTSQASIMLDGVRSATDKVYVVDEFGNEQEAIHAGTYTGKVLLRRDVKVADNDPNGYSLTWESEDAVEFVVEKASPQVYAPKGSHTYDGVAHPYNTNRATVADELPNNSDLYTVSYSKKDASGNYLPVSELKDAGTYLVHITYDCSRLEYGRDYKVETYDVQYSILRATIQVNVTGTERQFFEEGKAYDVDFSIDKKTPNNVPITRGDLMIQFLQGSNGMLGVDEFGEVYVLDKYKNVISINDDGEYVFAHSGRYAYQVIVKDQSIKDNLTITNGNGAFELVVTEIAFAPESDVVASLKVKNAEEGNIDETLLADSFEVRYVYKKNNLVEDDAYYDAIDSAFLGDIEEKVGTSATVLAIVRMSLTLNGNAVSLGEKVTTVSVELTDEILNNLDSTVIYVTKVQADGTTQLVKLNDYTIENGVLSYDTNSLGSLVFVKLGRETPMVAVYVGSGVAGGIVVIVVLTIIYVTVKRKRLQKMILG